jgi:hypothetical protein
MVKKCLTTIRVLLLLAMSAPVIAQSHSGVPPGEATAAPTLEAAERLPSDLKNLGSPKRRWSDRYACDNWTASQSIFDPTKGSRGPSGDNTRRGEYPRAMTSCLEAPRYSERPVAPAPYLPSAAARALPGWTPLEHASPTSSELQYHPLVVRFESAYSIATDAMHEYLHNDSNVDVGFTWVPTSMLPLCFPVGCSYSGFKGNSLSMNVASLATGRNDLFEHAHLYGEDLDAERSRRLGFQVQEYYLGGVGTYREQATFKPMSYESRMTCDFYECSSGYFPVASTIERNTAGWLHSWNAGLAFGFALEDPATFLNEVHYLDIDPPGSGLEFTSIRVGLRF